MIATRSNIITCYFLPVVIVFSRRFAPPWIVCYSATAKNIVFLRLVLRVSSRATRSRRENRVCENEVTPPLLRQRRARRTRNNHGGASYQLLYYFSVGYLIQMWKGLFQAYTIDIYTKRVFPAEMLTYSCVLLVRQTRKMLPNRTFDALPIYGPTPP